MSKGELPPEISEIQTIISYLKGESPEGGLQVQTDTPSVLLLKGNELYMKGNYKNAYDIYKKILKDNKGMIVAKVNLAFTMVRLSKYNKAEKIFTELPPEFKSEYVYAELGNIYARKNDLDTAKDYYKKALEKNSNFWLARINLAMLLLNQGEPEKAHAIIKSVQPDESNSGAYYRAFGFIYLSMRNYENALANISKYLEYNPRDSAAWLIKAECEARTGDLESAEISASKALELDKSPTSYAALAAVKLDMDKVDEAGNLASKAIAKEPENFVALRVLSKVSFLNGNYSKAYEVSTRALAKREHIELRLLHGEAARHIKHYNEAIADAYSVLSARDNCRRAMILKALALANVEKQEEALELLERAENLDVDFLVYTAYAEVYLISENLEKAAEYLEKAVELRQSPEHLKKLCLILYKLKELDKMDKYLIKLSVVAASDAYIWFLKGEVAFEKNMEEARKYYKLAVDVDPNFLEPYVRLAEIYMGTEDMDSLSDVLGHIIELSVSPSIWNKIFESLYEHKKYDVILQYVAKVAESSHEERVLIHKAKALIGKEKYKEAAEICTELHAKDRNFVDAKFYLAVAYYYLEKFADSRTLLMDLVENESKYELDANYYIARIYHSTGRSTEALDIADKYDYAPKFVLLKMEILYDLERHEEVIEYVGENITKLKGKELTDALIFKMRSQFALGLDAGFETVKEILARHPGNYEALYYAAEEYHKRGMYAEAASYAIKALKIKETAEVLYILAHSYKEMGKLDEALESADKLLDKSQKPKYALLKAEILYMKEMFPECIHYLNSLDDKAKEHDDFSRIAGKAHYSLENYDKSRVYFEKILTNNLGDKDVLYYLPLIYYRISDYNKAESAFLQAIKRYIDYMNDDEFLTAFLNTELELGKYDVVMKNGSVVAEPSEGVKLAMGIALYNMKRYEDAVKYLFDIKELDGKQVYYLTLSLIAIGRYEEANDILSGMESEAGNMLYYHGLVYYKLGKYKGAVEKFNAYLSSDVEVQQKEVYLYLGMAYYNLGEFEKAIPALSKAENISGESYKYEALTFYKLGDYANALRFFDICRKKEIMEPELWFMYGKCLEESGESGLNSFQIAWDNGFRNPEVAYLLMRGYYEAGELERAGAYAKDAVEYGGEARIHSAKVLYELENYEDALSIINKETGEKANLLKAKIFLKTGRLEQAQSLLESIARIPEATYYLIKLLVEKGEYEKAEQYFEAAAKHGNIAREKMVVYYNIGSWERVVENGTSLINAGEDIREATEMVGFAFYNLEKYEEAIEYLSKVDVKHDKVNYALGISYYKLGRYEEAIAFLSSAGQSMELGMCYYNIGDYENALAVLSQVEDENARTYAGLSAYKLDRYQEAVNYLEGNEEYKEELATSYFMIGEYGKVIELAPKNKKILGMAYYNLGDYEHAKRTLEELESKDADDYLYLAQACMELEDYDAAREYFVLARKEGYAGDTSVFEGIIAYHKGEYKIAVSLLKNYGDDGTKKMYGIALYQIGNLKLAKDLLATLSDRDSRYYYAKTLEDSGGRDNIESARDIFLEVDATKEAALCSVKIGEYDRALSIIGPSNEPELAPIKFEALIRLGRIEEAGEIYPKLDNDSERKFAKDMAKGYIELERYSDARALIERYYEKDSEWMILKAKVHIASREMEQALKELRSAKKMDPNNVEISQYLVPLYINAGNLQEALKEAKMVTDAYPDDAKMWYYLGLIFFKKNKMKDAISSLNKSIELDDSLVDAKKLLAGIYVKNEDYEDAHKVLSGIIQEVEDRDMLIMLSVSAYEMGNYELGLEYIDRANAIRRDHMSLYYKALILAELSRKDEAIDILKEVLSMKPDFIDARKLMGMIMGGE